MTVHSTKNIICEILFSSKYRDSHDNSMVPTIED